MQLLQDILYKTALLETHGSTQIEVNKIEFDSRSVEAGNVFVAVDGAHVNGHDYIGAAVEKGAIAVVCEKLPENLIDTITYCVVKDSADALGIMASNFYDNPSEEIKLIGITGTNGKTTTTTLLHDLVLDMGYAAGLLSTVVNKINKTEIPSTHTTPNPVALNELLREMVDAGCEFCFMEVSSHAIHQRRIAGLDFDMAGFTNITHDHLDYHKTFKEYIQAKKRFFDDLNSDAKAIVNVDDANGLVMVQNTKAKVLTFAVKNVADYKAKVIENSFSGLVLNINNQELWTKLVGGFNAYNIVMVYAIACELGLDQVEVLTSLSKLKAVEGRFEYMQSETNIIGIVDYAHTPDALKNVLSTIQDVRTKNEQVLTIVGCGGDRDKAKRPLMAEIAANMSDKVILTSDNPRSEDPEVIIGEMKQGIPVEKTAKALSITNRKEAIKVACSLAMPGDIVLIAGKGHEKYQEINGERFPFDDFETLKETLKSLNK
ncbi:UDP-N-acetylmuramoyl-L-alanyl-D-glutamate--2,6-diaminopimelate ligase [Paracrocinitomix mangrovi]|uniref:UDP-N-acetylmuramoyl-L-alanyl-D-glutamate--2, 6-diaminopimelate ligase n=1 Tax=Paracrocinitomix mangrovi TaxID=2862509 RepID=UPI001C8ED68A|nr:UDP-N-acetylmuramoyl-L-alanyl-D-glutamate--2,6-diaminopimelate ligase [Paracrocinitomix mangrovi]UKN03351.1 UDP-N-acetylmuramoyl-L-alanyl-D-glutamate--2,6-diaminopimelate ligase [Paracrocinitomix mangrovi]